MDLNEFRSFISESGVDVWTWIDMAISVASVDHQIELRNRRDGIIQKLFPPPFPRCQDCFKKETHLQTQEEEEQRKVLEIKNLLDDHTQNEKSLIALLQKLMGMNTTFKILKETEIGRHVTKLRKHSSNEVRSLVKLLVRKWRDTVDEWVRQNPPIQEQPTEKKAKANGIGLNDEDYEESQHAKKQTRPQQQVMAIHGDSISIKY